jgi:hypothetical protein
MTDKKPKTCETCKQPIIEKELCVCGCTFEEHNIPDNIGYSPPVEMCKKHECIGYCPRSKSKVWKYGYEQGKLDFVELLENEYNKGAKGATWHFLLQHKASNFFMWLKSQTQPRVECSRQKATQIMEVD